MTTLPPEDPNAQQPQQNVPPQQPQQPQQPPQQPQYEQQPPQQPQYAQQPVADPVSSITLNYWLSVFFTWLPALIFWIIEKDKGNQRATALHVSNFNFSLLRTIVGVGGWIIALIPYIGWIIAILVWIASIVLFVFHIMAAVKAPDAYRNQNESTDPFVFNVQMVK